MALADVGRTTALAAFAWVVLNSIPTIKAFVAFICLRNGLQRVAVQAVPVDRLILGVIGKISTDASFERFELRNLNVIAGTIDTGLGILHKNRLGHFSVEGRDADILIFQHFIYSNLY